MSLRSFWYVLAASMCAATVAVAQPANDLCTNRQVITPGSYPFDTTGAGNEATSCPYYDEVYGTVDIWYEYTAGASGTVSMSTTNCDSIFIAQISVYESCSGSRLACGQDTCTESPLEFVVTQGHTYVIRVATYHEFQLDGPGTLVLGAPIPLPANDLCTSATSLVENTPVAFDTTGATNTPGDVNPTCLGSNAERKDLWFSYTSSVTDTRVVTALPNGSFDPCISVYTACGGVGSQLACISGSGSSSRTLAFFATAGQTVYIRYGATNDTSHTGTIKVGPPAAGDFCTLAMPLTENVAVSFDTADTTNTLGDVSPTCLSAADAARNDLWFSYTPTATAVRVTAVPNGSITPCISVYTACGGGGSQLACTSSADATAFSATPGQTVYIRYGGTNNTAHTGTIKVDSPVSGDLCTDATPLSENVAVAFDLTGATNTGDLNPTCLNTFHASRNDLWFSFTPSTTGIRAVTGVSNYPPLISVYTACGGGGSLLACSSGSNAGASLRAVAFSATAGQTVYIRYGTTDNSLRQGTIKVGPPVAGDLCTQATPLTESVTATFNTGGSTNTPSDVNPTCLSASEAAQDDLWFSYTSSGTGTRYVTVAQTSNASAAPCLSVYTACGGAGTQLACSSGPRILSFPATAGQTAYIRYGTQGFNMAHTGTIRVDLPPTNDLCSSATPLTENVAVPFNTFGTTNTPSDVDPTCLTVAQAANNDVWFTYTPSVTATRVVTAIPEGVSFIAPCMSVYTACGGAGTLLGCTPLAHGVSFPATAGQTVYIRYGAANNNPHTGIIKVGPPVANDACASAMPLTDGVPVAMNTTGASYTATDVDPTCHPGPDLWFVYVPTDSGTRRLMARFDGSDPFPRGAIMTGCGAVGGMCFAGSLPVEFGVTEGFPVYIRIASSSSNNPNTGFIKIGPPPPPYDDCDSAAEIGLGQTVDFNGVELNLSDQNLGSSWQLTPQCSAPSPGNYDLWFRYLPESSGAVAFSTCGSQVHFRLSAYDNDCGNPQVECGVTSPTCVGSSVPSDVLTVDAVAGVPIRIRVFSGVPGVTGAGQITAYTPTPPNPCRADFDSDGSVTISDIFVYLNAWFSGSPAADMDGDGVNITDIFIFLNLWFAGCP